MRSKPAVPEANQALQRRLAAVEEMIEEDQAAKRAGQGAPEPEPGPPEPVTTPRISAEYPYLPPAPKPPPSVQVNLRVPYELDEEIRKASARFFGSNYTQFMLTAAKRELAYIKEHVDGNETPGSGRASA